MVCCGPCLLSLSENLVPRVLSGRGTRHRHDSSLLLNFMTRIQDHHGACIYAFVCSMLFRAPATLWPSGYGVGCQASRWTAHQPAQLPLSVVCASCASAPGQQEQSCAKQNIAICLVMQCLPSANASQQWDSKAGQLCKNG